MNKEKAQQTIKHRFWKFQKVLAEEYPKYKKDFEDIITEANNYGLLWEVLEFADVDLKIKISQKGSELLLSAEDYLDSLCYGYSEWIK